MWPFRSSREKEHASNEIPNNTAARGARGEKIAKKHLRRAGLKILAVNYRCPSGEVDLIALDRRTKPDRIRLFRFLSLPPRGEEYEPPTGPLRCSATSKTRSPVSDLMCSR